MQNNKKSKLDKKLLGMHQLNSLLEVAGGIFHAGSNTPCICYATQLK